MNNFLYHFFNLALTDFKKAIKINPNYAKVYNNRASVLIEKGNKQKAIQNLQKAAQIFKAQNNTTAYEEVMNRLK